MTTINKVPSAVLTIAFLCALFSSANVAAETISLRSLISEMVDRDRIAKWPTPEYSTRQASSYDRASVSPDKAGWFANPDADNFIRTEKIQGHTELVMMDADGPGCITRFWITAQNTREGTIRIYLDGLQTPALVFAGYDLSAGALRVESPYWLPHTSYRDGKGGSTLYLPIPFREHCKVTLEGGRDAHFYQIDYRTYAAGTDVESFTPTGLEAARTELKNAGRSLLNPILTGEGEPSQTVNAVIKAGAKWSRALPSGPSAVRMLQFKINAGSSESVAQALRSTVLCVEFDGEQTIWCPLGDFSGTGVGGKELHSWYRQVDPDGRITAFWVMPYETSATLTLQNLGKEEVSVEVKTENGAWKWDAQSMHFHSNWRLQNLVYPPEKDVNFVTLEGKGVFVGDALAVFNPEHTWYGEGDEKIWVDRETFPSSFGTGTEDYYNASWAPVVPYHTPFANAPRADDPSSAGHNTFTRSRNLDAIPFRERFKFDMELIAWKAMKPTWATTTYWYGLPGATATIKEQVSEAALPVPQLEQPRNDREAAQPADASQIVIADFEGENYGAWKTTGSAFGERPAQGTLPGQMAVGGFSGKGLANSFLGGDKATGTLTSPEFKIERSLITFLIGGGGFEGKTCVNLVLDGKVVRSATGPNTNAGGSEDLSQACWDVGELRGKTVRIVIVDDAVGGWGHINVDQIVQTDVKPRNTREVQLSQKYLLLPVRHGEAKRRTRVLVDGAIVREFDIELSDKPEWFAHVDVSAWIGKSAVLRADGLSADSPALGLVAPSATIWNSEQLYREPLRPQIHFSTARGWLNDPNGMVYADGVYHMFCQHNPYGWDWGNMHWAHAVSRDLVHWEELPIAIYPAKYGDWAFSGSAVVDKANTSGWKKGDRDVMVAAYTSTGRGECIVYSNDQGRTWSEYEGNPVVKHAGRDPRLLWHEATHQWVMAVYDESEKKQWIAFHTSPDLKTWTFQSRVEGFFECPDFFELPVDGNDANRKWVLTAASSDYKIGTFDGHQFVSGTDKLKGNLGRGYYAAQTFSSEPKNRVVQVGWMQAPSPGMAFNQAMSVPMQLTLVTTKDGPRVSRWPVSELSALREKSFELGAREVAPETNPLSEISGEILEIEASFEPKDAKQVEFNVRGTKVSYDVVKQELAVRDHRVPAPLVNGKQHLRLFLDRTILEVFASDGLTYVPMPLIPAAENRTVGLAVRGGSAKFEQLSVYQLGTIHKAEQK